MPGAAPGGGRRHQPPVYYHSLFMRQRQMNAPVHSCRNEGRHHSLCCRKYQSRHPRATTCYLSSPHIFPDCACGFFVYRYVCMRDKKNRNGNEACSYIHAARYQPRHLDFANCRRLYVMEICKKSDNAACLNISMAVIPHKGLWTTPLYI